MQWFESLFGSTEPQVISAYGAVVVDHASASATAAPRLMTHGDAVLLKAALAESTRREAVARESLRELKRASLEDAMAMSTRVEAMGARGGAMPLSAVEEQLGELESLVGELARRVPRQRRG